MSSQKLTASLRLLKPQAQVQHNQVRAGNESSGQRC